MRKLGLLSWEKRNLERVKEGEKFLPTATLAISDDEAREIKAETGVDLRRTAEAVSLCARMGLISLMIVNETRNTALVFDDGNHQQFDTIVLDDRKKEREMFDRFRKSILVGGGS